MSDCSDICGSEKAMCSDFSSCMLWQQLEEGETIEDKDLVGGITAGAAVEWVPACNLDGFVGRKVGPFPDLIIRSRVPAGYRVVDRSEYLRKGDRLFDLRRNRITADSWPHDIPPESRKAKMRCEWIASFDRGFLVLRKEEGAT